MANYQTICSISQIQNRYIQQLLYNASFKAFIFLSHLKLCIEAYVLFLLRVLSVLTKYFA